MYMYPILQCWRKDSVLIECYLNTAPLNSGIMPKVIWVQRNRIFYRDTEKMQGETIIWVFIQKAKHSSICIVSYQRWTNVFSLKLVGVMLFSWLDSFTERLDSTIFFHSRLNPHPHLHTPLFPHVLGVLTVDCSIVASLSPCDSDVNQRSKHAFSILLATNLQR